MPESVNPLKHYFHQWFELLKSFAPYRNTLICAVAVCVVVFLSYFHQPYRYLWPGLYPEYRVPARLLYQGLLYLLAPMLTIPLLRPANRLGLRIGRWRLWLIDVALAYLVLLVLILVFGRGQAFLKTYPLFKPAGRHWPTLFWYELILLTYMLGWEFMFRGYLLFGTEKELGKPAAVILQCVPFALLHLGKPELEAVGSIFAGLFLGLLALRANSFLPCAILHFAVACTMDLFAIFHRST